MQPQTKEEILADVISPQSESIILFSNSWSQNWGALGTGYFDKSYIPYVKELVIFIPPVTPVTPNPAAYTFTTNPSYGQTSADIHKMQTLLGMTTVTGFYGFLTLCAVVKFEIMNHLLISGTVSNQMLALLNT